MAHTKSRILAQVQHLRESRVAQFYLLAGAGTISFLTGLTAFAVAPSIEQATPPKQWVVEQLALPTLTASDTPADVFVREEQVRRGDTVFSLIRRAGVEDAEAESFMRENASARPLFQQLRPDQPITTRTNNDGELVSLSYPLYGTDRTLVVERNGSGFDAREESVALDTHVVTRSGVIRSSLFATADEIGMPDAIATQIADIFGGDIDFRTDLRRGDRLSVVYESMSSGGREVRTGRVLAVEFVNDGQTYRAVWYAGAGQSGAYYTPDGKSLKKAFLRSPLEFSRVTSGFSMRLHPILGTWRAHKGVDYGAPIGTKVRATADGEVEFVGQQNGYGNFIVLRHQDRYTTAYGHLNGFAAGLHKGMRVEQGQVIGYVGRTGWATGPHLHYEFRIAGMHQDPLSIALPVSIPLTAQQLTTFRSSTAPMLAQLESLRSIALAQSE